MTTAQTEAEPLIAPPGATALEVSSTTLVDAPSPFGESPASGAPPSDATQSPGELAHILHMQVPIIVKLAERDLPVGEVLKLNIGSILEFSRPVDAEMELLVNNRTIGQGMPVKVGENFGLRLTFVGNVEKTIKALGPQ